VKIQDSRGRTIPEVTLQLQDEEVTELMVAASQLEEGSVSHAIVRDPTGNAVALYMRSDEFEPLERQVDWWLGPLILIVIVLIAVGAFTVVRGIIGLLF
jgi:hypothetical protein